MIVAKNNSKHTSTDNKPDTINSVINSNSLKAYRFNGKHSNNKYVSGKKLSDTYANPTINANNPVFETIRKRGLIRDEFRKIFITGEITNWNQLPGVETDQARQYLLAR